jgi:hypothetical protein
MRFLDLIAITGTAFSTLSQLLEKHEQNKNPFAKKTKGFGTKSNPAPARFYKPILV